MPATKTSKLSGPQQVAVLGALGQQAAAHLVGMTVRHLRDQSAPRNEDGTYDACALLSWSSTASHTTDVHDADMERMLVLSEYFDGVIWHSTALVAIVDTLREFRKAGPAHLLAFAAVLVAVLGERRDTIPDGFKEAKLPRGFMDTEAERLAFEQMRVSSTCEHCGKLRRGTTWIKADVPTGHVQMLDTCPACIESVNRPAKT